MLQTYNNGNQYINNLISNNINIMDMLLEDKRSENTKRAYKKNLEEFFLYSFNSDPNPEMISLFLQMNKFEALDVVMRYKIHSMQRDLSEATVNRSLSAIKSLVKTGRRFGVCEFDLKEIEIEEVKSYRDTTGISEQQMIKVFNSIDRSTVEGKRNYILHRLLWSNALRREEICKLNVDDFLIHDNKLRIYGKGRGKQDELITIGSKTVQALNEWLMVRKADNEAMFISLSRANYGHRLTGDGLYKIVKKICKDAGISKLISPHRLRHSSITSALEKTNGNISAVKSFSRHVKVETVEIYNDNRINQQGKITDLLDEI